MRTKRSEDGKHPYFTAFSNTLAYLKRLAYQIDSFARIIPNRMKIINGTANKVKVKTHPGSTEIIMVKLYSHKVVQNFTFHFTSDNQAKEFKLRAALRFSQNGELII